MARITIICSPLTVFDHRPHLKRTGGLCKFPEATMGVSDVYAMLQYYTYPDSEVDIVTRRDETLMMVGHMIGNSMLKHSDIEIVLIQESGTTIHHYTDDGCIESGWPIGILSDFLLNR